jgi:hypothetical protein
VHSVSVFLFASLRPLFIVRWEELISPKISTLGCLATNAVKAITPMLALTIQKIPRKRKQKAVVSLVGVLLVDVVGRKWVCSMENYVLFLKIVQPIPVS